MRNSALVCFGMLLTAVVGCGASVEDQVEAQPSARASVPTSSEIQVPAQPLSREEKSGDATLKASPSKLERDSTVETHDGKCCTYNCGGHWYYNCEVPWGKCGNFVDWIDCKDARWCVPGRVC
jgi:hypothetical protein